MRPIRIALNGDVNLNIIDGSAIWLASLAQVLHHIERVRLTVLRKAPERRDLVTAELATLPRLRLVGLSTGRPLAPAQALDELERLDRAAPFDLLVLRAYALARLAARRPRLVGRPSVYLTDIEQDPLAVTDGDRAELTAITEASDRLLCQTEQLRGHLEGLTPAAANRTILLTPMVAPAFLDAASTRTVGPGHARRLFYDGKFAPGWGVLEMVRTFSRLRARHPDLELHVAGDKIHDPPDDPGFRLAVEAALTSTDGLVWHGGAPRPQVSALLAHADIALSPRDHRLDDSLELSTKLLEYGAPGVPVVCNRTTMHAELLGWQYPLFIDAIGELEAVLDEAVRDGSLWRRAADAARTVAAGFTYDRVADLLRPDLARRVPDVGQPSGRRPRVLVATHDGKFFTAIADHLARCGAQVAFDTWQGHARHDDAVSKELDRPKLPGARFELGLLGWIPQRKLSPSDDESFHLAPAEGMASGSVPVIWPWETAPDVYGPRWLCDDAADAAERIASTDWDAERGVAQAYVRRHYPLEPVVEAWGDLVLGGLAAP